MKRKGFIRALATLIVSIVFFTKCKNVTDIVTIEKHDTLLIYFTDSMPKKSSYSEVYNNFTKTRDVHFDVVKNWDDKTYSVAWGLWIDGEIAESNPEIFTRIKPEQLEKYKAKIRRQENERIPSLLKVWAK